MSIAGDLHWERLAAGKYETVFWANGYKYRIEKREGYYSTPEWIAYYRWDKWSDQNKWVRLRSLLENTLKDTKQRCVRHNLFPRSRYKFIKVVTREDIGESKMMEKNLGKWMYHPIDRKGQIAKWETRYLEPSFSYIDDSELEAS